MTEFDPGHRDTTREERSPGQPLTTPGRRFRIWEKLVAGLVICSFVLGSVAVIPASVTARQCPQQQQCPPPDDPPDNPPDDGGGDGDAGGSAGSGGGGGGQKKDGGQDGGRHGRDEGRPDLTALAGGGEISGQDGTVISAPANQQPLPMIINAPSPNSDVGGPVLDTPLPPPLAEEPVTSPPMPRWPLPDDPPPGHSELLEALPLPDHSETITAVEEQIAEAFEPVDSPGSDSIETLPVVEPAAGPGERPTTDLNSSELPPAPSSSAPAPSNRVEFILWILSPILKLIQDLLSRWSGIMPMFGQ